MAKALCRRCKGSAEGSTFEEASSKINHAVALSRSIPCGASYGCVIDVSPKIVSEPKPIPPTEPTKTTKTTKNKSPKIKTTEEKITEIVEETIITKE